MDDGVQGCTTNASLFPFRRTFPMDFVKRTIDLAMKNVEEGGRPSPL